MSSNSTLPEEPLLAEEFLTDTASRAVINKFNEIIESMPSPSCFFNRKKQG